MFKKERPRYETTVKDEFFCFIDKFDENGKPQYEEEVYHSDDVITITPTTTAPVKEIYASGKLYDSIMKRKLVSIARSAIGMPKEVYDRASGNDVQGAFTFAPVFPNRVHFAYGYYAELDDGTYCMRWYPDCVLGQFDGASTTETADMNDPNSEYTITAIPYGDNIKTEYFTGSVADGEKPLTVQQFFAQPIICKEDIPANADAE